MAVVSGKAAFAHLDSTEVYNGQDTGTVYPNCNLGR